MWDVGCALPLKLTVKLKCKIILLLIKIEGGLIIY